MQLFETDQDIDLFLCAFGAFMAGILAGHGGPVWLIAVNLFSAALCGFAVFCATKEETD